LPIANWSCAALEIGNRQSALLSGV
jgi:hypothetical protein